MILKCRHNIVCTETGEVRVYTEKKFFTTYDRNVAESVVPRIGARIKLVFAQNKKTPASVRYRGFREWYSFYTMTVVLQMISSYKL